MNNIITEMKNTLEEINSKKTEAEEWETEWNKDKRMKINEGSLRDH